MQVTRECLTVIFQFSPVVTFTARFAFSFEQGIEKKAKNHSSSNSIRLQLYAELLILSYTHLSYFSLFKKSAFRPLYKLIAPNGTVH